MMSDPGYYLQKLAESDMHNFLLDMGDNYATHRPLLLLSLSLTDGNVIEMGSGLSSTKYLRDYCSIQQRGFISFDSDKEWCKVTDAEFVEDWDSDYRWKQPCGLLFIDHRPGEHRKIALDMMKDKADIIVVHDTELGGGGAYGFEPVIAEFKYVLHYNRRGGGAGATAVSNKIDLSQFKGLSLGKYKLE